MFACKVYIILMYTALILNNIAIRNNVSEFTGCFKHFGSYNTNNYTSQIPVRIIVHRAPITDTIAMLFVFMYQKHTTTLSG